MRRKLIETDPEMTQKIELVEEIIKTIIRLYSIGLSRLVRKREDTINQWQRRRRGDFTDTKGQKWVLWKIYDNKLDNLYGKNSQKRQNAKLPQESIDNLCRPTNIKGIEFVVKTFLSCFHKESSSPSLTGASYQTFKEEIMSILTNFFQETQKEGIFANSCYKVSIVVIFESDKEITKGQTNDQYPSYI